MERSNAPGCPPPTITVSGAPTKTPGTRSPAAPGPVPTSTRPDRLHRSSATGTSGRPPPGGRETSRSRRRPIVLDRARRRTSDGVAEINLECGPRPMPSMLPKARNLPDWEHHPPARLDPPPTVRPGTTPGFARVFVPLDARAKGVDVRGRRRTRPGPRTGRRRPPERRTYPSAPPALPEAKTTGAPERIANFPVRRPRRRRRVDVPRRR